MSASEYKEKGDKHLKAREFDAAIEAYTNAIAINPNDYVFYSNRSAAYLSKGDAIAALRDAEDVIRINASWAKGYSRKGNFVPIESYSSRAEL
jgi:stress-induced-phosphoprotein 1